MIKKLDSLFILLSCALVATTTCALETLDDAELGQTSGQDGVTLGFNLGTTGRISFDHIVIEDRDGIPDPDLVTAGNQSTHPQAAGLGYITQGTNKGVQFLAGATPIAEPFSLVIDADGNNNNPVMNIGVRFAPNLSQIKLDAFSLGLVKINPTNLAIDANSRRDILKTGSSGLDILFNTNSQLGVNLQLGSTPQTAMFLFSGGSIERIKTDEPIEILSYAGCATNAPCASNSSIKLGFDLTAQNTTGIGLAGMYMTTNNNGLEIGKTGTLDGFGLKLSNVTMGNAGAVGATSVFNGLPNAAIGTIGLENVQISDLKVNVRGL